MLQAITFCFYVQCGKKTSFQAERKIFGGVQAFDMVRSFCPADEPEGVASVSFMEA